MLDKFYKIGYFLCLVDDGQLNLPDIAFIIILGKILVSPSVDWAALVTLAISVLNSMHNRQTVTTASIQDMTAKLQKVESIVDSLKAKI